MHEAEAFDNWAEANRVICDWIHRGKPLRRLGVTERVELIAGEERPYRLRYVAGRISTSPAS
jgi:hypothetical protein